MHGVQTTRRFDFQRATFGLAGMFALFGFFLLGCAGSGLDIQPIPVTTNPSEQVASLASELDAAQAEGVAVLSPTWFGKAQASLDTARQRLDGGSGVQKVLETVSQGRAELARARSYAQVTHTAIPKAVEAREAARNAGATSLGGEGYAEAESHFLALSAAVEDDELAWATRKQAEIVKEFRDLELAAIEQNTLGEVRRLIKETSKQGGVEFAPKALARAKSSLADVEQFIEKDRYASEQMSELAAQALFEAKRALQTTQEAKLLSKQSPEQIAAAQESVLASYAKGLNLADLRDQSFTTQRDTIRTGIDQLTKDRDFLVNRTEKARAQVEELRGQIAQLEGQNATERARSDELESERQFNALYSEVSNYFDPSEAEVYKQGQSLVVRLRGIQFPVGQHVLMPDDYALLAKVQRAVRAFGEPKVVIEGHTDTTGSADMNDLLSQQRAEAVMEYLVANNTLARERIVAIGKGFAVPLASNVSAEGRALNRRIDVIIDASGPVATPAVSSGGK